MNYDDFFKFVKLQKLELDFDNRRVTEHVGLNNEALFHLPLIAMTVLLMASGHRKPKVERLGQLVGDCFERTFQGFKGSSQHLGWSANLRVRTVRALSFLETSGLIAVANQSQEISATPRGKDVLLSAKQSDSPLSKTLLLAERCYRDLSVERQISMEL